MLITIMSHTDLNKINTKLFHLNMKPAAKDGGLHVFISRICYVNS